MSFTQDGFPLGDSRRIFESLHCISSIGIPELNCLYGDKFSVSANAGIVLILRARINNPSIVILVINLFDKL